MNAVARLIPIGANLSPDPANTACALREPIKPKRRISMHYGVRFLPL